LFQRVLKQETGMMSALRGVSLRLSGFRLAAVGFVEAVTGARGAAATVAGDAKITAQVFQCTGATLGGFANLAVGDSLANADVHGEIP
jgi:hypothetical protein